MAQVSFGDNGFDYCDTGNFVLFSAGDTHEELFDYVSKDLSKLPDLFEKCVSKTMDITTFEMIDYQHDDNDSAEIKDILASLHPYYKHEYTVVINKVIGDYFNALLVYSQYKNRTLDDKHEEKWYIERFTKLAAPFLQKSDMAPRVFHDQYEKWIDAYDAEPVEGEERFVFGVPTEPPKGFDEELEIQKTVQRMLYWILDISAPNIGEMTMPQRMWIYSNMFWMASSQSNMKVSKRLLFRPNFRYRGNNDYIDEVGYIRKIDDLFRPLYALSKFDIYHRDIPLEMLDDLNRVIEYAKTVPKADVHEEYEIDNLHQLLYLEILFMIKTNTNIRRCKHCGKYFVMPNRKTLYCSRIAEGEKESCFAVGSKRSFQKKMEAEYPLKIYNRAYKTHHARVRYCKIDKNDFILWRDKAKEKLKEVRNGNLDIFEFEKWLKI